MAEAWTHPMLEHSLYCFWHIESFELLRSRIEVIIGNIFIFTKTVDLTTKKFVASHVVAVYLALKDEIFLGVREMNVPILNLVSWMCYLEKEIKLLDYTEGKVF